MSQGTIVIIAESVESVLPNQNSNEMVEIGVDLDDATFVILAKEAHRRDITFNDFMVQLVLKYVEEYCPTESD